MPKTMLVNNKADTQIHTVDTLGWQQVAGGGGGGAENGSLVCHGEFLVLHSRNCAPTLI